jgi:hypothetical protein
VKERLIPNLLLPNSVTARENSTTVDGMAGKKTLACSFSLRNDKPHVTCLIKLKKPIVKNCTFHFKSRGQIVLGLTPYHPRLSPIENKKFWEELIYFPLI